MQILISSVSSMSLADMAKRVSSEPYISGDTFRDYADFIVDETNIPFSPEWVQPGDVIFVKTDYLSSFFETLHPQIAFPYILLSHNSDIAIPGDFAPMLDDPKLIAWFGQNIEGCPHPKLHPIPIGIANKRWEHGNTSIFDAVQSVYHSKSILLYMNFALQNNLSLRLPVYNQFINEPYCRFALAKGLEEYLKDLASTRFVLSPRGNGLDCHRTWEALYLKAIPIVISSTLDPLFEDLPVLIIQDWSEVTEDFLMQKYEEFKGRTYNFEKLETSYWFSLIDSYRNPQYVP
jgi:hypothetical protein